MNRQAILAVALGLISSAAVFADQPLVKMQVEAKLVQLTQPAPLVKLAQEGKLVLPYQAAAAPAPTTPPPVTREARFKALYGATAAEDDAAIRGLLGKDAGPVAQPTARASETGSGIRGLLNKQTPNP
ncbi:MAG: hypothetical protein HY303_01270 [Candidatus Wallbacteria bacterium]|nr:hypothetical protein [Candidatus Wallbacteria bacterium]